MTVLIQILTQKKMKQLKLEKNSLLKKLPELKRKRSYLNLKLFLMLKFMMKMKILNNFLEKLQKSKKKVLHGIKTTKLEMLLLVCKN